MTKKYNHLTDEQRALLLLEINALINSANAEDLDDDAICLERFCWTLEDVGFISPAERIEYIHEVEAVKNKWAAARKNKNAETSPYDTRVSGLTSE